MGVYYYFYNKSKNYEQNKHVLSGNFCDFITLFNYYNNQEQIDLFKKCITLNNWNSTDIILAVPDYYDHNVFIYENETIMIDNSDKNLFFETS